MYLWRIHSSRLCKMFFLLQIPLKNINSFSKTNFNTNSERKAYTITKQSESGKISHLNNVLGTIQQQ